jgi:23S rRNA-/tRNA-specific pseudouridylate synthase
MENDKPNPQEEFPSSDSLYEHYAFSADPGQAPLRVDKFLMARIENATRNKIQQAAKAGSIFVGDKVVKSNYKVKGGDQVKVLFSHPPYENLLVPEPIPIILGHYLTVYYIISNNYPIMQTTVLVWYIGSIKIRVGFWLSLKPNRL